MNKCPTFFIVGVEKCGTTSLYEYLKKIPEIFMSPKKEPWYFSPVVRDIAHIPNKIKDEKSYLRLFNNVKNETAIGEASAVYWRDPEAPKLIQEKIPHAKIIISLRDPVDRYFSGYLMEFLTGLNKKSIHESIQNRLNNKFTLKSTRLKKESSFLYYDNVKRYLDIFGKDNVLILIFEEWIKNPKKALGDILEFLKIDSSVKNFDDIKFDSYNVGWVPKGKLLSKILSSKIVISLSRKPLLKSSRHFIEKKIINNNTNKKLDDKDKQLLIKFFYTDVKKLEKLFGKQLPWPNFKD